MSHKKNKIEILDATIKKAEMDEHNLGWNDDYEYGMENDYDDWDDPYYCCESCTPRFPMGGLDYEYDMSKSNKDGRMIDLDSISISRKRNSIIDKVLGEQVGVTTIGDVINAKL